MKTNNPVRSEQHETVLVGGRFRPQGVGVPIQDEGIGSFTVVRAGVGRYTITFAEQYVGMVAKWASIQMNAATDLKPQFVGAYDATARTIELDALAVAAPTEIAANANNAVDVMFLMRVTKKTP